MILNTTTKHEEMKNTPSSTIESRCKQRVEREPADARPGEHGLDSDGAADELAGLQSRPASPPAAPHCARCGGAA